MNEAAASASAALFFFALTSGAARASEPGALGLSYDADASCPGAPSFAALVRERAESVALVPASTERAEVAVVLRQENGSFRGTLRIRRTDGNDYVREMQSTTCSELSSALAFVAALALRTQEQEKAEAHEEPASIDTPAPIDETEPLATVPSSGASWTWGATVGLGIRFGIAPTWANTEQLDVEGSPASESVFSPLLRFGVVHAEPVTRIDRFGTTKFTWTTVRASGCPLRVRLVDRFELRPCVGLGWGMIGAAGAPATSRGTGRDELSGWADVFGALRFRVHVWRPLWAVAEAELAASLTPYDFAFDPSAPVYAVPPLAGAGFVGLSGQIP
jgi:hypothetical protein